MVRTICLAVALTALSAGTALAQDRVDTEFIFLDEDVRGDRDGTDLIPVHVPPRRTRTTLVQPRTHFVAEMLRSVQNL